MSCVVSQWARQEVGKIDVDFNDSSRGRDWRWLDDGRKGQRAWHVMARHEQRSVLDAEHPGRKFTIICFSPDVSSWDTSLP